MTNKTFVTKKLSTWFLSQSINTYPKPIYLVKAGEDEWNEIILSVDLIESDDWYSEIGTATIQTNNRLVWFRSTKFIEIGWYGEMENGPETETI